jgi:hypothetical protein
MLQRCSPGGRATKLPYPLNPFVFFVLFVVQLPNLGSPKNGGRDLDDLITIKRLA